MQSTNFGLNGRYFLVLDFCSPPGLFSRRRCACSSRARTGWSPPRSGWTARERLGRWSRTRTWNHGVPWGYCTSVHLLDSTVILKNLNSYLFLFLLKIVSINKQRIRLCKDDISYRRTFFVHPPNKRSLIFFLFILRCDGFLREVLKTLFIKCTLFVSYLVNLLVNTLSNK